MIASRLVEAGMATLLFDLSGHGDSSEAPEEGIEAFVSDLKAAFEWALSQESVRRDAIGIAGSSLGALVAARAVIMTRVAPKTMVLRAPPLDPAEFRALQVPSLVLVGSLDPLLYAARSGTASRPVLSLSVVQGASHLLGARNP